MDDRKKLLKISYYVIELFHKDFGPFKGLAKQKVKEKIDTIDDDEIEGIAEELRTILGKK